METFWLKPGTDFIKKRIALQKCAKYQSHHILCRPILCDHRVYDVTWHLTGNFILLILIIEACPNF